MGVDLAWWVLILIVVGICLAAGAVGLLISYMILRAQNRPWPYARLIFKRRDDYLFTSPPPGAAAQQPAVEPTADQKARREVEEATLRLTQRWQADRETVRDASGTESAGIVGEIEADLSIARSASRTNLQPFETAYFDDHQKELLALADPVRERLTAVYTDMQLANRLVALSRKGSAEDADMANGYLKLCSRISTELEALMPAIKGPLASG